MGKLHFPAPQSTAVGGILRAASVFKVGLSLAIRLSVVNFDGG